MGVIFFTVCLGNLCPHYSFSLLRFGSVSVGVDPHMNKSPANWENCLLDQRMLVRVGVCLCVSDCACVSGLCRSAEDFLRWSILTCLAASSSLRWDCRSWCQPVLRSMTSTSITATTSTVTQGKLLGFRFPHKQSSLDSHLWVVISDISPPVKLLLMFFCWLYLVP